MRRRGRPAARPPARRASDRGPPCRVHSPGARALGGGSGGGQISFALSPSGVSSLQPVAASRVRDCAPSPAHASWARGSAVGRALHSPLPSRPPSPSAAGRACDFSPLGGRAPLRAALRCAALLRGIPGARGNPTPAGPACARSGKPQREAGMPRGPLLSSGREAGPGGRVRPAAAVWAALGSPGCGRSLPVGAAGPRGASVPGKSKELS